MKINAVNMTIADYCAAFDRNEVTIDRTYQRSPNVWPLPAQSYLIETLLREFPIPKLALHQVTDTKSKKTVKKVVDGQQRSSAIRDFFNNKLRLAKTIELQDAAGHTYDELTEDLKGIFLSYMLDFDQFEAATDEDVREYFRRINSFTAPLNSEEQRHARFQGPMKWFVHGLSSRHGATFVRLGVIAQRTAIRMSDTKLLAEIVSALTNGVTTTSKSTLDKLYHSFDKSAEVPRAAEITTAIDDAIAAVLAIQSIHTTALMKTHVFYSLVLAHIAVTKSWPELKDLASKHGARALTSPVKREANLLTLAAALDEPELYPDEEEFSSASADKTNVKAQRETRVRWLAAALTDTL